MKKKMSGFWILIFSTMYVVDTGRHWVSARSPTQPPVYQPDKELTVDIGDTATLRCCVSENLSGIIDWFKQPNRKKPQIIVTVYKNGGETFYNGFLKSRVQIKRSLNCCNLTILQIIQNDEGMYYCAQMRPNLGFGDGTFLKIKGDHVTLALETSKPALYENSVVLESTPHENIIITTHEETMIGSGSAFGLCAMIIFCVTFFILRRRKFNASTENSPGARQVREAEDEMLNYAALKFSKRKVKAEKRKTGLDECVYSDVKRR
ncbi:uncharacterized protein LOC124386139 [Silurus meridionalis]|uniref:uncharacterized protein LOC124386139 n=1 Tax=Silurus meridionalis TaxID=175797 RepID=UPI001EEA1FF0|nr:uncharacterized protein LOC124386139 [Silurus meridionalis]